MNTRRLVAPEKPAKTGEYSNKTLDRVASVHDKFVRMRGSVTGGKAERAGLSEAGVLSAVGIMETSLGKQTKRGYMYNFDDRPKYAADKAEAMAVGDSVAAAKTLEREANAVARPEKLLKYTAPSIANAIKLGALDEHRKDKEIAAGMHVMQKKMKLKSVDSLEKGLLRWRGVNEPGYISSVKTIAKQLK